MLQRMPQGMLENLLNLTSGQPLTDRGRPVSYVMAASVRCRILSPPVRMLRKVPMQVWSGGPRSCGCIHLPSTSLGQLRRAAKRRCRKTTFWPRCVTDSGWCTNSFAMPPKMLLDSTSSRELQACRWAKPRQGQTHSSGSTAS